MKIKAEQLKSLTKPLKPCYLISGDETLLCLETADLIKKATKNYAREIHAVDRFFKWDDLRHDIKHQSLFSGKKLIELRLGSTKFNKAIGESLLQCIEDNQSGHVLLVSLGKTEASTLKTKWFTALEKQIVFIQIWPIEREQFPQWIKQRLSQENLPTDPALVEALTHCSEGNLLAAQQHIKLLSLLGGSTPDMIAALDDQSRFSGFEWVASTLMGDAKRSENILEHLKLEGEEPILILWALTQELRLCSQATQAQEGFMQFCKTNRIWPKRQAPMQKLLKRTHPKKIRRAIQACAHIDKTLKGALREDPWQLLSRLSLRLAS